MTEPIDETEPQDSEPPRQLPAAESWKDLLVYKKAPRGSAPGVIEPKSLNNIIVMLGNAKPWKGVFVKDEFSGEILVHRCPIYEDDAVFEVRRLKHTDIVRTAAALEFWGLSVSMSGVENAIKTVAEEHTIHPVREYFDALRWDGEARLDTWLRDYINADGDPDYLAAVGSKWMIAAVRRIYQPGCKFDTMPVFEGVQGIGKSFFLRTLATFGEEIEVEYFTDAVKFADITTPSSIKILQGKLIIEIAELAGMNKRDLEDVKNWITIQVDEIQQKYENPITAYPRQFVLAGTTNESQWLRDPTGNRRFWPVRLTKRIDMLALRAVRTQLWAEAVHRHKEGESIYIVNNDALEARIAAQQAMRMTEDPWTDAVMTFVENTAYTTTAEIMQSLAIDPGRRDEMGMRRIARILTGNGWTSVVRRSGSSKRTRRFWKNPRADEIEHRGGRPAEDIPFE